MLVLRASFEKIRVKILAKKTKFNFFSKVWTPVFAKLVSATGPNEVVMCHVAFVAGVLGSERNAVFNGLLFVGGASQPMSCITYISALRFGAGLDVLGASSRERRGFLVMSEMCIAVGTCRVCTAQDLATILGSTWPSIDTVGDV